MRVRYAIEVDGLAQGVGFRPFVHGLALSFDLGGTVYNAAGGVHIEVEGDAQALTEFVSALSIAAPSAARPRGVTVQREAPRGERVFHIAPSHVAGAASVALPADLATCAQCVSELFDHNDRRFTHPFISCTQCGPRATVILDAPYDRERTSMADFTLCTFCRAEYEDPTNRRFHAQSIACHECGPQLYLLDRTGRRSADAETPLEALARTIDRGAVGALKGIGGFHLICDATNDAVVRELRQHKQRDAKPFAVMVSDVAAAERLCELDPEARAALESPARPIVLARAKPDPQLSPAVAPGVDLLGLILPYAPVHHLLLRRLGRPLVVTSGNRSSEPIAANDGEALEQLADIANTIVSHERAIVVRYEDSVVRARRSAVTPLRRARGYAPLAVELGFALPVPTLALGGHYKSAFALGVQARAVLGPHCGDLDGYRALATWREALLGFARMHRVRPARVVHDLHPDYASTRHAREWAAAEPELQLLAVQHHHAHMASCMADNALAGDVIGVCFDGSGLGSDGSSWGGEFLTGGYARFERAGHLQTVPLPGGDRVAREPWRAALAHAWLAGDSEPFARFERRLEPRTVHGVRRMLETGVNSPSSSSMGRLFDAVAALAGVLDVASYEGEAALRLETLARRCTTRAAAYPVGLSGTRPFTVDRAPIIVAVAQDVRRGVAPELIARRFHCTVVELVLLACARIREQSGLERVVLSGGVFANEILSDEVPARLRDQGFAVFAHRSVPANDGGLCLGQLAIAAHHQTGAA